jgi:hypothetical protein
MITYEFAKSDLQADVSKPQAPVVVLLDGKVVGKIVPPTWDKNEGYQYVTKNNHTGDVFPTFRECQRSLEAQ